MAKLTAILGYIFWLSAPALLLYGIFSGAAILLSTLLLMLALQLLIGWFLILAAKERSENSSISHKVYPASVGSAILYLLFFMRWIADYI